MLYFSNVRWRATHRCLEYYSEELTSPGQHLCGTDFARGDGSYLWRLSSWKTLAVGMLSPWS